ncbi:hypothetical protein AB0G86_44295, partial [Streptomyces scabiei]|uniref:hypothetical protein n=1 Tax=Streptomyces scabiei TaxID=1930 RepID=UPI0033F44F29
TATPTTSTAHLSAVLVDLGPDTVRDYAHEAEGLPAGHRPRSERSATAGARVPEAGGQSVEAPTRSMPSRSAKSV